MTFHPPQDWLRLTTIDGHTAGEPLRLITSGFPELPGETILAKRRHAKQHCEPVRRALMWEPRGHADMYGCLLTPPVTDDGDVGVLFLHNEGYSTMCGHAIIGLVTFGLQTGILSGQGTAPVIRIDSPAGRITATAQWDGERVRSVSFENVASFLLRRDLVVQVDGLGDVRCDIGYGGAFYAYVEAKEVGVSLTPEHQSQLIDVGMRIKRAVTDQFDIVHPEGEADLNFLYGTIFVGAAHGGAHSRNVCIFAEGEVDRSPTGTGVSGRAAVHFAKGELDLGQSIRIESILGTCFDVEAVREVGVGERRGIVPRVTGSAHLTGRHEFWIDPEDPCREGFLLR